MSRAAAIAGFLLALAVHASAQNVDSAIAAFESSLHYSTGTITLGKDLATIRVPSDFRFLGPSDSRHLLEDGWGNPPDDTPLGMLVPAGVSPLGDEGWGVIITFEGDGYVKDDDAATIDYAKLLAEMQKDTKKENPSRKKAGYDEIELVGWAEPPHYDAAAHKLYWAQDLRFGDAEGHTLNYNVRVLGRRGVLVLNAVSSMDRLATVRAGMTGLLPAIDFNSGHRYSDFAPSVDKVAAYGIAGLIAGHVAAKVGLFKVLIGLLVAAKKAIVVAALAVAAFFKRLFGRKQRSTRTTV